MTTTSGTTQEEQTQWLVDRAEITDTLHRWLDYVDTKQFHRQLDLFTEDCEFEFPWGTFTIPELHALRDADTKEEEAFTETHHMVANHRIDIDGDSARVNLNLQAVHVRDPADADSWWILGGRYEHELRRTEDRWKISRAKLMHSWETGQSAM